MELWIRAEDPRQDVHEKLNLLLLADESRLQHLQLYFR
jgi:hypothetical protein